MKKPHLIETGEKQRMEMNLQLRISFLSKSRESPGNNLGGSVIIDLIDNKDGKLLGNRSDGNCLLYSSTDIPLEEDKVVKGREE